MQLLLIIRGIQQIRNDVAAYQHHIWFSFPKYKKNSFIIYLYFSITLEFLVEYEIKILNLLLEIP